jgi:hypothetical protein
VESAAFAGVDVAVQGGTGLGGQGGAPHGIKGVKHDPRLVLRAVSAAASPGFFSGRVGSTLTERLWG